MEPTDAPLATHDKMQDISMSFGSWEKNRVCRSFRRSRSLDLHRFQMHLKNIFHRKINYKTWTFWKMMFLEKIRVFLRKISVEFSIFISSPWKHHKSRDLILLMFLHTNFLRNYFFPWNWSHSKSHRKLKNEILRKRYTKSVVKSIRNVH